MSVLKYFKNTPRSPSHRATCLKCNFFLFKFVMRSLEKKRPCRPPNGRQAPVAPGVGDRPLPPVGWAQRPVARGQGRPLGGRHGLFFPRDLIANLKKKIHLRPVALWGGDRGVFLKYFKTYIYF